MKPYKINQYYYREIVNDVSGLLIVQQPDKVINDKNT